MDWTIAIILIALTFYLSTGIRIAHKDDRFAVYRLGRFTGFRGPGLVYSLPGNAIVLVRISLGMEGMVLSDELASINDRPVPFYSKTEIKAGTQVRIIGFGESIVDIEPIHKFFVCEQCGHRNPIKDISTEHLLNFYPYA